VTPQKIKCPYCGRDRPQEEVTTCYYCKKELEDEYIVLVDEESEAFPLCSTKCLDLLFEFMEAEEEEEEY